jgi:cytochrome c oxidase subunit 3
VSEGHGAAVAEREAPTKHQFDDLEQQHDSDNLGMWVFLITEIMFFGGLFASYTIFRSLYPEAFAAGSRLLEVKFGATNTVVLIVSSLTMAMAVHSAHVGNRKRLITFLIMTMILGLVFVGLKLRYEWYHDWVEGVVPGFNFHPSEESLKEMWRGLHMPEGSPLPLRQVELFMCFYFFMTGVHALHMVVGEGILTVLLINAYKGNLLGERHFASVEISGLYWHFVDIIWIFLFPLLYLIGGRYV